MNIAFYTISPVNPYIGGVERVTYNLSESFRKRGIKVYNICKKGQSDETHFILPSTDIDEEIKYVNFIIGKYKINVIIDQYGCNSIFSHKFINKDVKIIRCIHLDIEEKNITQRLLGNFYHKTFKQNFLNFLFWLNTPFRLRKKDIELSLSSVDRFVVLSPNYIERLKKKGIKSDKIISIPNGTYIKSFNSIEKKNVLLFCGRVVYNPKNVFFLLDLWQTLQNKYKDWELVIAGGGEDLENMKKLAQHKKLQRISFPGFVDPSNYYLESKILLLPSFSEGFGMILLEGMTSKCVPIVFNTSPSFKDILDNGKAGIIVDGLNKKKFIEKCEMLMQSPKKLNEMAENAKFHIDINYSMDKITDKWISLFDVLVKS